MLPIRLQEKIALGCYAIVANMFATFNSPKNCGPNFTWENFPTMMKGMCSTHIFLNTPIPEKHRKAAKEHAEQTGFEIAKKLVKEMQE